MKKLLSLLLPLALALSLAACGEKSADEAARQTPPTLTVTSANACSVTLKSSSYDWTYTQGLQSMTAIACGAHPLDETSRDITPVLEMPFAVSAAYFYTVTLDFGDNSADSVSLRCWPSDAWGTTGMPSETVTAQRQDNGTFRAELPQSDGIFAVDALWDGSSATYTFCTQAEGSEELHPGAVLSIGESEDIRKIDISWRSGSVNIYTAEQSAQISVKGESAAPLAESEKMVCAIDGDTLRIHFLGDAYRGSYDGEKHLDVGLPRELVSAGHFEEIKVETTDAYTIVGADVSGRIKLSTVGGDARVMGATCPTVEIETVNGSVGVVDGTWGKIELSTVSGALELAGDAESAEIETASGKVDIAGALGALDFESVSGNLFLATERALRLDAETESGSIYLTLPAQDGFTLDYETKSGAFRSTLTEREGALITCGDHEAYYTVPALDGGAVSELELLLKVRRFNAFGEERDYFDHPNIIGFTREGLRTYPGSGLAFLCSDGPGGQKRMYVGTFYAGTTFRCVLGGQRSVVIDGEGCGVFSVGGGGASLYVPRLRLGDFINRKLAELRARVRELLGRRG